MFKSLCRSLYKALQLHYFIVQLQLQFISFIFFIQIWEEDVQTIKYFKDFISYLYF